MSEGRDCERCCRHIAFCECSEHGTVERAIEDALEELGLHRFGKTPWGLVTACHVDDVYWVFQGIAPDLEVFTDIRVSLKKDPAEIRSGLKFCVDALLKHHCDSMTDKELSMALTWVEGEFDSRESHKEGRDEQ